MAGQGLTVTKSFTVASGGTVDFNLASVGLVSGNEFDIHNIYFDNTIQMSTYDGTTLVTFDSSTGAGSREGLIRHVNNSQWIRITNSYTGNTNVSFDGIQIN